MVIDFHTHTFPNKMAAKVIDNLSQKSRSQAFTNGTVDELLNSMNKAEIDLSIVLPVATKPEQVPKVNDASKILNDRYESKIISFACMHPDYENYISELKRIKNLGFKGIKIHPVYQGVDLDDLRYLKIFDQAAQLDLIVITHSGLDIGFPGIEHSSPLMARNVIEKIGNFKFVLAHMGAWRQWKEVTEILADKKIFIDTAFSTGLIKPRQGCKWNDEELKMLNADQFIKMIKTFGVEQILFGTDSPWSDQLESKKFIEDLNLSTEDKNKILGENAKNLLFNH